MAKLDSLTKTSKSQYHQNSTMLIRSKMDSHWWTKATISTLWAKKAEKLVEGVVRSGNCHELPNYMKDVFPRYECISLYHGDICEQIEKEKEDQKKNKK
jgi:hypothetical protein